MHLIFKSGFDHRKRINISSLNREKKNIEISIRNLKKEFGNLIAVNNISLDLFKGEILGFLGPNGAGKTTTINMLSGLLSPTSGEIIFGNNESGHSGNIKGRLGICPQENVYWPKLTCREQLIFMAKMYNVQGSAAREKSDQLLITMGLQDKSNVLAKKLSGGMKRRLSISLALVHDPDILVLDEPEAGLDPQSRVLVRDFIKNLAGDKTIIITTHNMDEADRLSDRVAIIDHGKLLLVDTPDNLKKTVGDGDLMVLTLQRSQTGKQNNLVEALANNNYKAEFSDDTLRIYSRQIIGKLNEITKLIESCGFNIREMNMRENTLEDVFIHLTGRKLRS